MKKLDPKLVITAVSILLTAAIVLLLLLIGPKSVEAVNVTVTPSPGSVAPGGSVTFDLTVEILASERIPIEGIHLRIFSDAEATIELTASPYNSPLSTSLFSATPSTGYYGYGYGYGFDPIVGQGYSFGYGYGYGYGYDSGTVTLVYRCTVDTSGWAPAVYYARGDVDCGTHTYSSSVSSFVVAHDWDLYIDGCINVSDLILVGQHWQQTGDPGWIREDIYVDGIINVSDLILVGQHWREGCT